MVNDRECAAFVEELLVAFPSFDDAARNSPDLARTHRSWAEAWKDLEYRECVSVLARLKMSGGIGYEDFRSPGPFIRRLVMAQRKNTPKSEEQLANERQDRLNGRQKKRDYTGSPMSMAMAHALELKKLGVSKETIFEEMDFIVQFGAIPKHSEKFKRQPTGRAG